MKVLPLFKNRNLILFLTLITILISCMFSAHASQGLKYRYWKAAWEVDDPAFDVDDDTLHSIIYSVGSEAFQFNVAYTTGDFDGANLAFFGNDRGWTPVTRERDELEASFLGAIGAGEASVGIGGGLRYIAFNVDFDALASEREITLMGPFFALSYSQKAGPVYLSGSGTFMALYADVDYKGSWNINGVDYFNGINEQDVTWGYNAQFAVTYPFNETFSITGGYKYQLIKEKDMGVISFTEEEFSGLFVEAGLSW